MTYGLRRLGYGVAAAAALLVVAAPARADFLSDLEAPFREALASGNWTAALAFVFLAGLATSLTPCVYPMIVITVSIFGARQAKSRLEGALLSTAFVLGIATLFTPLGVVVAMTGGVFGAALASPWVVGPLALIFTALALGMFGAFELNLPPAMQNRLAQVGGVGVKGAFALGFVSALVAAPCTGPVLAVLLLWIGTTGNVAFGGLSLFIYALGLGMLFWIVGTFAVSLPKSGRWLEWVKSTFGIVMLVMAIYYLRDLLPFDRPDERADWMLFGGAGLAAAGVLVGAIHLSYHTKGTVVRARKTIGIIAAVVGMTMAVFWLEAMPPLPPGATIAWEDDFEAAKARALADGLPMMVDFGASWCGACEELERNTFTDPRVVRETRRRGVVPVRIDLSPGKDTPENRAILASYEQRGLPLVVLHNRAGDEVARVTSFIEAERLLELLDDVE